MLEAEFSHLLQFLPPLFLTILIESGIAWLCRVRELRFYKAMLWINAITNPLLCLFLFQLYRHGMTQVTGIILICETLIVLAEWRLLLAVFPDQKRRVFFLSLAMNAGSYSLGILIYHFWQ